MSDLEKKPELLIHSRNFYYAGYEISAIYPLLSTTNLTEIKQYQFLYPTVTKLSMRNDYLSLKFIK